MTPAEVVELANGRCNQENVIEQLKNGVNAMRVPVNDLLSNWAYMVIAALAWNLKAWFALTMPDPEKSGVVLKMEFRRFLNTFVRLPCQIIRQGRRIVFACWVTTRGCRTFCGRGRRSDDSRQRRLERRTKKWRNDNDDGRSVPQKRCRAPAKGLGEA